MTLTSQIPVLVVDDNPSNLKLMRVLLVGEGFQVKTAENAVQAQETLKHFQPSLILMDIQLPGMDGLTLTRLLKSKAETAGIPVVAITAYAMSGDEQKALDAGCVAYVAKPVDTRTLPQMLRDVAQPPKD
jgi:CheY-like chemotaxis protein